MPTQLKQSNSRLRGYSHTTTFATLDNAFSFADSIPSLGLHRP